MLSLILDLAVNDGRLARNVASGVNLPRTAKLEHRYLTHDQMDDLATACGFPADPSKHSSYGTRTKQMYWLVVLFLAYTGVRFTEMAALRVSCLDLRRHRVVIAESVTLLSGQGMVWESTKNHRRCKVPIPQFHVVELSEQVANKGPDDLVFASILDCAPPRFSTLRQQFGVAVETVGIPYLQPHQLRHTAATLAIASGADVKFFQQMLGHSSATIALDTYGTFSRTASTRLAAPFTPPARERRATLRAVPLLLPQPSEA